MKYKLISILLLFFLIPFISFADNQVQYTVDMTNLEYLTLPSIFIIFLLIVFIILFIFNFNNPWRK